MNKLKAYVMDTKLFWRLYFWWGIRQARKRRIAWEEEMAKRPRMTNDEYWDMVNRRKQND